MSDSDDSPADIHSSPSNPSSKPRHMAVNHLASDSASASLQVNDGNSASISPVSNVASNNTTENSITVCSPETRTGAPLNMTIYNAYPGRASIFLVDSKCNPVFYYTLPPSIASRQLTWRNYMWYAADNETGTIIDRFTPLTPWSVDWIIRGVSPVTTGSSSRNVSSLANNTASSITYDSNQKSSTTSFLRAEDSLPPSQEVKQSSLMSSTSILITAGVVLLVSGIMLCAVFVVLIRKRWRSTSYPNSKSSSPEPENKPRPPSIFDLAADDINSDSTVGAYFLKAKIDNEKGCDDVFNHSVIEPGRIPTRSIVNAYTNHELGRAHPERYHNASESIRSPSLIESGEGRYSRRDSMAMRTFFSWLKGSEEFPREKMPVVSPYATAMRQSAARRMSLFSKPRLSMKHRPHILSPVPESPLNSIKSFEKEPDILIIERAPQVPQCTAENSPPEMAVSFPEINLFGSLNHDPPVGDIGSYMLEKNELPPTPTYQSTLGFNIYPQCDDDSIKLDHPVESIYAPLETPSSTFTLNHESFECGGMVHNFRPVSTLDTPIGEPSIPIIAGRKNIGSGQPHFQSDDKEIHLPTALCVNPDTSSRPTSSLDTPVSSPRIVNFRRLSNGRVRSAMKRVSSGLRRTSFHHRSQRPVSFLRKSRLSSLTSSATPTSFPLPFSSNFETIESPIVISDTMDVEVSMHDKDVKDHVVDNSTSVFGLPALRAVMDSFMQENFGTKTDKAARL